jgi:hypothetical protein
MPLPSSMLSGFTSRWTIRHAYRCWRPFAICNSRLHEATDAHISRNGAHLQATVRPRHERVERSPAHRAPPLAQLRLRKRKRNHAHAHRSSGMHTCIDPASSGYATASVCVAATAASSPMRAIRADESSVVNTTSADATCAAKMGGRPSSPTACTRAPGSSSSKSAQYRSRKTRGAMPADPPPPPSASAYLHHTTVCALYVRTGHDKNKWPTQPPQYYISPARFRGTHMSLRATRAPVAMCRARNTAPFTP